MDGTVRGMAQVGSRKQRLALVGVGASCRRNDSLIAKLIVHGRDRSEALARMNQALDSFIIEGVTTTIPFLRTVLSHPEFVAGCVDTKFLERHPDLASAAV